jgi:hypothetical protein
MIEGLPGKFEVLPRIVEIGTTGLQARLASTAAKYSNNGAAQHSSARLLRAQRASARLTDGHAVTLQARG